jgi:hypothetical protein
MRPVLYLLAFGVWLAPVSATAAPLATGGGLELPLLRLTLGFIFCAMVAFAIALIMKRGMAKGLRIPPSLSSWMQAPTREIEVRETRRISANADVCAIEWRGRDFLVLVCAGGAVSVLDARDTQEPPTS